MTPGNQVLSQEEIDSLVSSQALETEGPVKTFKLPPPDDSADEVQQAQETGDGAIAFVKSRLAELTDRLHVLETSRRESDQREASSLQINDTLAQMQQSIRMLLEQVHGLAKSVKEIESNLEATPGYHAHKTFTCASCHSTGLTAIRARCTQCGKEFWWGWYPE